MSFVAPALASPLKDHLITPNLWSAEEKFDGHRLIVRVGDKTSRTLFEAANDETGIRAWSRDEKDRILPPHLRESLRRLPDGIYDGELLVPGRRSFDVTVLENVNKLVFMVFDVVQLLGRDLTFQAPVMASYDERRSLLEEIFRDERPGVKLAWSKIIKSRDEISVLAKEVWARDGEGLILKRRASPYAPGKRTKDWLKIKQLRSAVLTVIGFTAGTMGQHSVTLLRDEEGYETSVKWKNLDLLRQVESDPDKFVGRRLMIEYQERTPDGGYRHPRWDRWETE